MRKIVIRYSGLSVGGGIVNPEQILDAEHAEVVLEDEGGALTQLFTGDAYNAGTVIERKFTLRRVVERGIALFESHKKKEKGE